MNIRYNLNDKTKNYNRTVNLNEVFLNYYIFRRFNTESKYYLSYNTIIILIILNL